MISLYKLPGSKLKLNIWSFFYNYQENYELILNDVDILNKASFEIKNNENFKKIISYILAIGNILNGGTQKGQADGFSLDILSKISSVKDNNNKTLTQYICNIMKREDDTFDGLKGSCLSVIEATKISFTETLTNLNKIKKELKDELNNLNKLSNLQDEFYLKSNLQLNKYSKEIEKIDEDFTKSKNIFQETVSFYGYQPSDEKYKNPEKFFELINNFINEIERALPKDETKNKVFNRKHEVGAKIIENTIKYGKLPGMDNILQEMKDNQNGFKRALTKEF